MRNGLTITLIDPSTGRKVLVPEPDPGRLGIDQAVRLEQLARRWCQPATRRGAQAELEHFRATAPAATVYGFSWLLAIWALLHEARTGTAAQQAIRALDGGEVRRYEAGQRAHELWDWLTHTVQMGALAVLARDEAYLGPLDSVALHPAGIDQLLVQHQLVLIDAFARGLVERLDLSPWGITDLLAGDVVPEARTA